MKLYMYERGSGLSITELPAEKEGQMEIQYTNTQGKRSRLLDVEGDSQEWRVYSTIGGRIHIDGDFCEDTVLQHNLLMNVETEDGNVTILCSEDVATAEKVHFYQLPMSGIIRMGSKANSEIRCEGSNLMEPVQAEIHIKKDEIVVDTSPKGAGVYINYLPCRDKAQVTPGSILDAFGIRIVVLNRMIALWTFYDEMKTTVTLTPCEIVNRQQREGKYNKHMIADLGVDYERSPRIGFTDELQEIAVESPPPQQKKDEMPLIFSVGSSAFMSISSIMMAMNTISTAQATGAGLGTVIPSVAMAAGMFAGSLLMPIMTRKYNNKQADKKEQVRQGKYKEYLKEIDRRITEAGEQTKKGLLNNYLPPAELIGEAEKRTGTLWSHMPFHQDFLTLRLGIGETEPNVDVRYPAHNFTLEEDEMRKALEDLEGKSHLMKDVPMMLSLRETGILGVIAERDEGIRWVKGLLVQLCTYHSYQEMKLVLIYDKAEEAKWEFARWLPHTWSDNGEFRAIGTEKENMRNISAYIDSLCPAGDQDSEEYNQMCVAVLADPKLGEQCYALQSRMEHIERTNLRVIALAGNANELPKECTSVVVLENGQGALSYGIRSLKKQTLFNCDPIPEEAVRPFATRLLNTHLSDVKGDGQLADMLTMFDMLRCGNVEQVNAPERWKKSNPVKSLAAPVGVDKYGGLLNLDIHQDAHGPHGLIAGMTGSGKSEFIITYILSMAINYSPLEVGFILIDYKGGGMSDTLADLPHVIGVIDNLGGSQGIRRSLVSIKSEILRRQIVFKEIGEKKHISNMDIYKYQSMYRNGELDEPMQHLILISDEFAELKEQESDFMDDIVSMARIGRSLGVHLILATQKPTGVVSPQIASNARFHVCLKVQDRSDSMEILARPEAAMLTKTGRFYLQVGFNEIFEMGQSAWCGAAYQAKPVYVEEPDYSFELLNDLGQTVMRTTPELEGHSKSKEKQVDTLVHYLRKTAEELDMMPPKGWKHPLAESMLVDEIDEEYKPEYTRYALDPTIGVIDDPKHQDQYALRLNFSEEGNAIVYGFAGAGKHEMINSVIYSLCKHHTAEEINIYCLDFGSESARMFAAMPQVGDVIVSGEDEKILNFVRTMSDEMENRRKKLSSFGGNINLYRTENTDPMPSILVTVDNYAGLIESYPDVEDELFRLVREGNRFGIWFMITCLSPTSLRYRLTQNFKQVLCLQMMDKMDYTNVLGKTEGNEPMSRLGSGLIRKDEVMEFQAGFIFGSDVGNEYQQMAQMAAKASEEWTGPRAPRIRVLPEHVKLTDVCDVPEKITLKQVPLGIDKESMLPVCKDMTEEYIFPVLYSVMPEIPCIQVISEALAADENRKVYMVDTGKKLTHRSMAGYTCVNQKDAAIRTIEELFNLCAERHNRLKDLEKEGKEPETFPEIVAVFVAINELYDLISDNEEITAKLDAVLKMGRTDMQMGVILVQEARTVSSMSLRIWYDRIPDRDGLWLGDGIQMQTVLKSDVRYNQKAEEEFGFMVKRGKARLIKMIEERR